MRKILIIGGAGFIGINSARYFLKKGWKISILDDLSRAGTDYNIKKLREDFGDKFVFKKCDITKDTKTLQSFVNKNDVVLHLAAQVAVTTSISYPEEDFRINVVGTFNVLEAIRKSKNKPFVIYSSTNKVYGSLTQYPVLEKSTRYVFKDNKLKKNGVSENTAIDFHSPYGCSKGAADHYVIDYGRIYGFNSVSFRQSCVYGEYQMGIEDQGWVAWFAIASLLGKKITVFGTGKQVRDLLYVGDLVRLYELAIQNKNKVSGKAFNVGGGVGNTLSIIEYLNSLEKKLGIKIKTTKDKVRAGDQPIFISDNSKIERTLGWKPKISTSIGLDRMISWIKNNQKAIERAR